MKTVQLGTVRSINIEDVPSEFKDEVWDQLPRNGGNVIRVDKNTPFGQWLERIGYVFSKTWGHLVVFR